MRALDVLQDIRAVHDVRNGVSNGQLLAVADDRTTWPALVKLELVEQVLNDDAPPPRGRHSIGEVARPATDVHDRAGHVGAERAQLLECVPRQEFVERRWGCLLSPVEPN